MSNSIKRLIIILTLGVVSLAPAAPAGAWTVFQENAVNEHRPLYDPFECDPNAPVSGSDLVQGGSGAYIAAGNIPKEGLEVGATYYGGGYRASIGTKYDQAHPGWYPSNDQQKGETPYDDNGMGNDGKPLPGRTVWAELKNGQALGGLPNGTKLEIQYGDKKIIAERGDIGGGGADIGGKPRAVDLWWEAARLLDFKPGSGVVKIHAVDKSTPVTALTGSVTANAGEGSAGELGNCCATVEEETGGALSGRDNAEKAFNFFKSKGLTDIQAAGVIGNLEQESGMNPKIHQGGGGVGRGIAQWSAGARWETLKAYAAKTNRDPYSLGLQLDFLWKELQGDYKNALSAIKKATTIQAAVRAFQNLYEICGQCEEATRIKYANKALKLFGTSGAGSGGGNPTLPEVPTDGSAGGGCGGASGVVAGDIAKTAVGLAWPDPLGPASKKAPHDFHTSTPAYKKAKLKVGDDTDCGVFVATVMRTSGADKNYLEIDVSNQRAYAEKHPELYTIIKNPKSTKDLQPGDIMIVTGHTSMWVGAQAGGYTVAEASLGGHTPDMRGSGNARWMFGQPNPIIVRRK